MRCEEFSIDYPDYVRGTLAGDRRILIDRHAAMCTACRRELDSLTSLFSVLDRENVEHRSDVDWGRFLVEMHRRIDAPARRWTMPSPATRRILYPMAFAVCVLVAFLFLPPLWNGGPSPIFTDELRSVISSLDTAETAILLKTYVDPVTAPASMLPVGTHPGIVPARDDLDASLVFNEIDYNDLLAASMEYLDQGTILDLLPAEQSRILLEEAPGNGHL